MKSLTLVAFSFYSSCLWLLFASSLCTLCFCNPNSDNVQCIPTERLALIQLKNNLTDPANRLSSWSGEDCCSWSGVVCDNFTRHVHELHLSGPNETSLGGIISPSLIKLQQLRYLDLSCNDFGLGPIPAFIGSLHNLRYLNVSYSQFVGEIPHQLGNLSALLVLDVHDEFHSHLYSQNLKWIENLKQLQYLDMSFINLTGASDWFQVVSTLPSLQELHLSYCGLSQIPSELTRVSFTSLTVLDLSYNNFHGLFPGWVFRLRKLITLDLSFCDCGGLNLGSQGGFDMPSLRSLRLSNAAFVNTSSFLNQLPSLSNLSFLDVRSCDIYDPVLVKLQNLSQIVHLDLSYNHIVEEIPKSLSSICKMTTLDLRFNNFSGDVTELLERFCECESPKLESLGLSDNNLTGRLPEKLGRLKNLASINIAYNRLSGILPRSLGSLSLLESLYLNNNQLEGSIQDSIGDLSSLEVLDLSYNRLNGSLPESIGKLGKLRSLGLDYNSLTGIVTENHFANLTALSYLSVGDNKLAFDLVSNWIPPFQLEGLRLVSCSIGPLFPSWLQSQTQLTDLDLSNANISDTIPDWIWSTFSSVSFLNISHNNIMGKLGDVSLDMEIGASVDLSYNQFHGELPSDFGKCLLGFLDLSYNNFSGSLDQFLCSGCIEPPWLSGLNLANNNLSGGLPDCWMNWNSLQILNLEKNKLSGKIPSSLGNISSLVLLDMRNNKLSGEIPMSLFNSERLVIVKLAENELTGRIPASVGRNDASLKILSLRSNKLSGEIPNELCGLSSIQILDLADNSLSGYLPKCFNNFSVFSGKKRPTEAVFYNDPFRSQQESSISLVIKGQIYSYSTIVYLVTALDLSSNKLTGSIPKELTLLPGLRYLNLSRNKLTGRIPDTVGEMRELESLDLSVNHLQGTIPMSLAGLTALSWLNVSYNSLTGTIPTGRQLQTFNESGFIGNALCGAPLAACRLDSHDINGTKDDHNNLVPSDSSSSSSPLDDGTDWILVICMTVGLAVGFWTTIGTLIVSQQLRDAYYRFLDDMTTKLANSIFLVYICEGDKVEACLDEHIFSCSKGKSFSGISTNTWWAMGKVLDFHVKGFF